MLRTWLLLAAMTALFMGAGFLMGGVNGMLVAFAVACGMNFFAYWFSGSMALAMYKAHPLTEQDNPELYAMVERLALKAGIPTPKAYLIDNPQPNAFATGRNPQNGTVAVTTGLLSLLDSREVAAVLAHEIGHIKNRDTLIMTVTATLAGAVGMLANFFMFFGGRQGEGRNPIASIALMILAPLAATLVQLAISRAREYEADAAGAEYCGDPLALASALRKISGTAERIPNMDAENNPATAHMFIVNPLHGMGVDNLFSTHPSPAKRILALEGMAARPMVAPRLRKGSFRFSG